VLAGEARQVKSSLVKSSQVQSSGRRANEAMAGLPAAAAADSEGPELASA
jgi:hypothetical protein